MSNRVNWSSHPQTRELPATLQICKLAQPEQMNHLTEIKPQTSELKKYLLFKAVELWGGLLQSIIVAMDN